MYVCVRCALTGVTTLHSRYRLHIFNYVLFGDSCASQCGRPYVLHPVIQILRFGVACALVCATQLYRVRDRDAVAKKVKRRLKRLREKASVRATDMEEGGDSDPKSGGAVEEETRATLADELETVPAIRGTRRVRSVAFRYVGYYG